MNLRKKGKIEINRKRKNMKDHIEVEARSERHGSVRDREKIHDREVKDK